MRELERLYDRYRSHPMRSPVQFQAMRAAGLILTGTGFTSGDVRSVADALRVAFEAAL